MYKNLGENCSTIQQLLAVVTVHTPLNDLDTASLWYRGDQDLMNLRMSIHCHLAVVCIQTMKHVHNINAETTF
ncbi:hypothetical protein GDO81_013354 [Engystomops pustulosus]|uniref:Uncharacterized protein n=1 Tax=Engystomops pustulosus TaxID=76066 RepID=A0AAV7B2T8_ENGPU|nr:hypothetical protein GDO81_013354 [Engystomops pustulosus]